MDSKALFMMVGFTITTLGYSGINMKKAFVFTLMKKKNFEVFA